MQMNQYHEYHLIILADFSLKLIILYYACEKRTVMLENT